MTFFYDLNKRLANLSQQQTLTEGAVAERATGDYSAKKAAAGKDIGKPGKNFSKIAADAVKRYGSKAAGERVAGAVLNKLRNPKESMAEGQLNELSPELLKRARDKAGMKYADADDRRDQKASDKYNRLDDKFNSALRKKQKGMAEAELDEVSRGEYIKQQDTAAEKSGKQKFNAFGQTFDTDEIDEGGLPMTTVNGKKVPKFAADGQGANDLAKKKSFNDKIAGAKQEVEEMLGDVAAEAMRSALGGKKQMADEGTVMEYDRSLAIPAAKALIAAIGRMSKLGYTQEDKACVEKFISLLQRGDTHKARRYQKRGGCTIRASNFIDEILSDANINPDAEFQQPVLVDPRLKEQGITDEGFDDMERDVKRRLSTPKVGDVKRGARHDIETTATGIRATRRQDDETDDQPTGEKRKAGRPKSLEGPRQERTTAKSRKTDRTAYSKKKTNEGDLDITDRGEYDQEGDMAKDTIKTVVRHAQALEKILGDNDNLPEWVQSKLAKIESMMTAVDDYMQNQEDDQGDEMPMGEESTNKRDNRAERAGKRVTKDIESDEKKKEKKVAETTSSGSVATGGDAPKSSKGGMQVGKGIYDSLNRKVEGMIAESMSINVSMTKDDNGSHKNITVTASDEDAEALAQLLRSAGLGGDMSPDHGHEEPCSTCGSTDCGCDENMAEAYGDTDASQNEPNWPTDTEYSDNAMQYSGGLNGPKSTGQTTVPVIAHQGARTGVDDEELRRMMEMAGIKQQELKPWERTMKEDTIEEDELDEGWKEKMAAAALAGSMALGAGGAHAGTSGNQDAGSNTPQQAAGQTVGSMAQAQRINYQLRSMINTVKDLKQQNRLDPGFEKDYNQMQTVSNTGSPDSKVAGDFANAKMLKQLFQKYNMTLPYVQEDVAEGVVDKVKDAVKKGLEKLGHGSDEDMRKDLQKKMGVPPTGKKPEDKKMEESLMQEFANFRI